jgi:hypothetical protein
MTDDTAYRMVYKAARLFKERYGDYPERIGLDIKTRHAEYCRRRGNHFTVIEPEPLDRLSTPIWKVVELDTFSPPQINLKRTEISIEPLVFPDLAAWEASHLYMALPMPDEVWCQWGETTAKMSLWFTEQGWHCIEWDEWENTHE